MVLVSLAIALVILALVASWRIGYKRGSAKCDCTEAGLEGERRGRENSVKDYLALVAVNRELEKALNQLREEHDALEKSCIEMADKFSKLLRRQ